jgi:hypothetical protein
MFRLQTLLFNNAIKHILFVRKNAYHSNVQTNNGTRKISCLQFYKTHVYIVTILNYKPPPVTPSALVQYSKRYGI